jgi:hypothetical protein
MQAMPLPSGRKEETKVTHHAWFVEGGMLLMGFSEVGDHLKIV